MFFVEKKQYKSHNSIFGKNQNVSVADAKHVFEKN